MRATEDENPELFWALHGGGGNFGIATALDLPAAPAAGLHRGVAALAAEAGPELARAYRDFIEAAPDEVGGGLHLPHRPA